MAYDDFASWFLSKIIIKDVQTGEKYEFICNQWLAVEHGDGEVYKIFSKKSRINHIYIIIIGCRPKIFDNNNNYNFY